MKTAEIEAYDDVRIGALGVSTDVILRLAATAWRLDPTDEHVAWAKRVVGIARERGFVPSNPVELLRYCPNEINDCSIPGAVKYSSREFGMVLVAFPALYSDNQHPITNWRNRPY